MNVCPTYISDLDGTLLRSDASLSDYSRDTLNRLIADGLAFTAASARSVVSMREVLAGLEIRLPVIEFNGAFISDLTSGRHWRTHALDPDRIESLHALILESSSQPFVAGVREGADRLYYQDVLNDGMRHYVDERTKIHDGRITHIGDLTEAYSEPVVCLNVVNRRPVLEVLTDRIDAEFPGVFERHLFENTYLPGWFWLTIHDRRASKDQAIRTLAEEFDVSIDDLTVFGDNDNDVSMFQMEARGIAVANATDRLKLHADEVIGSNDEDSVAAFIERDWAARREELNCAEGVI